jgi:hypothetical protein
MTIWALTPIPLLLDPSLFGLLVPHADAIGFLRNLALVWLGLAIAGLLFRTVQLFFIRDVMTGLVWATKILTDPFNDIRLYWRRTVAADEGRALPLGRAAKG